MTARVLQEADAKIETGVLRHFFWRGKLEGRGEGAGSKQGKPLDLKAGLTSVIREEEGRQIWEEESQIAKQL